MVWAALLAGSVHGEVAEDGRATDDSQAAGDAVADTPSLEQQRTVAEILALQERIGRLLRTLPPELRDSLVERLEAMATTASGSDAAAGTRPFDTRLAPDVAEAADKRLAPGTAGTDERVAPGSAAPETAADKRVAPGAEVTVVPPPVPTRGRLKSPPTGCNTLTLLDSDGDGWVSASDRYWRHLYLWSDVDGNGAMQEHEVRSAYERGVRALDVGLDTFERAAVGRTDGQSTVLAEVEVDRYVVLDVSGDGFELAEVMIDDGVLVVDAGKMGRGDGPTLLDETGLPLSGLQAFRSGLRLIWSSGASEALDCP